MALCTLQLQEESLCAGWWAETGAWVPRDWALRPSYDTRVAIINAMYACGENVQKLMPVLLTEAVRRDRHASPLCFTCMACADIMLLLIPLVSECLDLLGSLCSPI